MYLENGRCMKEINVVEVCFLIWVLSLLSSKTLFFLSKNIFCVESNIEGRVYFSNSYPTYLSGRFDQAVFNQLKRHFSHQMLFYNTTKQSHYIVSLKFEIK